MIDRADKAFIRWYAFYQLLLRGVTTAMPIAEETHGGAVLTELPSWG